MEELFPDTKCAYLNSCAGNVVTGTQFEEDGIPGITYPPGNPKGMKEKLRSQYAYAAALATCAYYAITKNARESETDTLAFCRRMYIGKVDHSKDHLAAQAKEALKLYEKEGHTPEAKKWCAKFRLGNVYACGAILQRAALPKTDEIELNAIRIGDCGIATIPFEPYCTIGTYIKEHSPFAMTIANGYCCGYHSYLPTLKAHPDCYESSKMPFMPGTAEAIGEKLSEMLNTLK